MVLNKRGGYMRYALNLSNENRILSATFEKYASDDAVLVELLPEGDITDYLYIDCEYIYEPLPVVEIVEQPSQLDIIEAQVTYTAMMTDTLLEV